MERTEVSRTSTGSKPLDKMLEGGLEEGVIANFFGESGTGKTNVCIQAAAAVSSEGGEVAYVDSEGGFSPERFVQVAGEEQLGSVKLLEPSDFSEQERAVERIKELDPSLAVVDSLVSLYRLERSEENVQEANSRLSDMLSELSRLASDLSMPVLVTNQVYSDFEDGGIELVGKDVPRYWCKCLVRLETLEEGLRRATVEKHRSIPEGRSTTFRIATEGLVEAEDEGLL